jgi:hypothetical protein
METYFVYNYTTPGNDQVQTRIGGTISMEVDKGPLTSICAGAISV